MVVVFKIEEINYLTVSLFCNLVRPFSYSCLWYEDFGCAICLVSGIATKAATAFPKSFTIFQ